MRRVRSRLDEAERARLLEKARGLASYMFIADPSRRPANLDEMTPPQLRAVAAQYLNAPTRPMALMALAVLDQIDEG